MDSVAKGQSAILQADGNTLQVGIKSWLVLTSSELLVCLDKSENHDGKKFRSNRNKKITGSWNIPLYNILWVELLQSELIIQYAAPSGQDVVATVLKISVEPKYQPVKEWIAKLLDSSYQDSQPKKRAKVLLNPHSGRKKAVARFSKYAEPLLRAAGCSIDMVETTQVGDGVSIAEKLDIDAFDMIVICSGDGLAHEVFNGLGKRSDAKRALTKIAVAHIPGGSANGLSRNLNHTANVSKATLSIIKGVRKPMDLVLITQEDKITLSYLSQAIGTSAESDLATEHLRWMGETRFVLGFFTRIWAKKVYPAEISVKIAIEDKNLIMERYEKEMEKQVSAEMDSNSRHPLGCDVSKDVPCHPGLPPLKYGTINEKAPEDWVVITSNNLGTLYCGNVAYMSSTAKFFRTALHNDGMMDLILIDGNLRRCSALQLFSAVADDTFFDSPLIKYQKILAFRWTPKNQDSGYISIDGERIPFKPFQAEVHKGLGTVIMINSKIPGALDSL